MLCASLKAVGKCRHNKYLNNRFLLCKNYSESTLPSMYINSHPQIKLPVIETLTES